MYHDTETFQAAIRESGLEPPSTIEAGKIYRFPGNGKGLSNRAGWCLQFDDGLGGCYGDWSSSFSATWHAKHSKPYSVTERANFARKVQAAKKQAETERNQRQADAAYRAARIWHAATPASANHPYLIRKHIQLHGAKLYMTRLTLPVTDFSDRLTSLQFIAADGGKRLLSGGRKRGCFIPVTRTEVNPSRVIICEGWATGCTLAEDEPNSLVLTAIDAGNLKSVAIAARCRWSSAELVIAGDDDQLTAGNPGDTKAKAAASASGAMMALPQWPEGAPKHLTDFNDLAVWQTGGEV